MLKVKNEYIICYINVIFSLFFSTWTYFQIHSIFVVIRADPQKTNKRAPLSLKPRPLAPITSGSACAHCPSRPIRTARCEREGEEGGGRGGSSRFIAAPKRVKTMRRAHSDNKKRIWGLLNLNTLSESDL